MINTLEELLDDYARYSCMEDKIDSETSQNLINGTKDYINKLYELSLIDITDCRNTVVKKLDT